MVIVNNMMKYMTRIGQKTGTFNAWKNVQMNAITTALNALYLKSKGKTIKICYLKCGFESGFERNLTVFLPLNSNNIFPFIFIMFKYLPKFKLW